MFTGLFGCVFDGMFGVCSGVWSKACLVSDFDGYMKIGLGICVYVCLEICLKVCLGMGLCGLGCLVWYLVGVFLCVCLSVSSIMCLVIGCLFGSSLFFFIFFVR